MPIDDYLTAAEAAKKLKVHPETIKRLCRQGELPADKLGNTWLIKEDTLSVFAGTYRSSVGRPKRLL